MKDNIRQIPPLILKRLTDRMTEEEKRELATWAQEDEANAGLLERLSDPGNLATEIRRRRAVTTDRQLADMKARIGRTKKENGRRTVYRRIVTGAAAAVLLLVGMTVLTSRYGSLWQKDIETVAAGGTVIHGTTQAVLTLDNGVTIALGADQTKNREAIEKAEETDVCGDGECRQMSLATPRGGEFRITLEDGTEVWLNAQSRLCYPERFDSCERRVRLEGEAYFKVAHNTSKPFIVESDGQQVRVTGTEFNINSYREDAYVYTTLVSGGIALSPAGGNGSELIITPGHQAVFGKEDRNAGVRTVDTDVVTSWRTGSFVFENQTLEQIMTTLSRWYDFDYEFMDDAPKTIVFMGSVPRYGEFGDVLKILEMSGNIRFTLRGKHLDISSAGADARDSRRKDA